MVVNDSAQILEFEFFNQDVLSGVENVKERILNLKRGEFLGNHYGVKSKITFVTSEGKRSVNSQIWMVSDHGVKLKEGPIIPIQSILEVQSWM